jgi:hypothetical protein
LCIGHKKIDAFAAVAAARVRLNLLSTTDAARIREFALCDSRAGDRGPRASAEVATAAR